MGLSKQRIDVLKIIKDVIKNGKARDIELAYEQAYKTKVGNVHQVLYRLVEDGYITRVEDNKYELVAKGINLLTGGKKDTVEETIQYSKEEVEAFKTYAEDKEILNKLSRNVDPKLCGLEKERLALLLSLVSKPEAKGERTRINVLYTGEPGSGKTSIIKWTQENLGGFWADSDTTESALKGTGKGGQFREGLLSMANRSTLFIDELDKMSYENQDGLLASLEQGKFTIHKDEVHRECEAKTKCVATANDKNRVKEALRDRFDLKFHLKALTPEDKEKIIRSKLADWGREKDMLTDLSFFKDYLRYAKKIRTKLPENREYITKTILERLEDGKIHNMRSAEAIVRISLAIAQLKLKAEVGDEEIKEAIELIKEE